MAWLYRLMDSKSSNTIASTAEKDFHAGRHMKAHGIGGEGDKVGDDEYSDDYWEEKFAATTPNNKLIYTLRRNPYRSRNCRPWKNCGMEFSSWKSFLEHGSRSRSDEPESSQLGNSPKASDDEEDGIVGKAVSSGWSKRKRSSRAEVGSITTMVGSTSSEEQDLASCLIMLSDGVLIGPLKTNLLPEESSCALANNKDNENYMGNSMTITTPARMGPTVANTTTDTTKAKSVSKGLFECKACKKVFTSHQALGGHRASHKKVKGCFAARLDQVDHEDGLEDDDQDTLANIEYCNISGRNSKESVSSIDNRGLTLLMSSNCPTLPSSSKRKTKVHECSICHRRFASGQALGGHKRGHWITSGSPDTPTLARLQQLHDEIEQQIQERPTTFSSTAQLSEQTTLDLNLPAPNNDDISGLSTNPRNINQSTGFLKQSTGFLTESWTDVDAEAKEDHHHPHKSNGKKNI